MVRTGVPASDFAQLRPAKPAPTITTVGRSTLDTPGTSSPASGGCDCRRCQCVLEIVQPLHVRLDIVADHLVLPHQLGEAVGVESDQLGVLGGTRGGRVLAGQDAELAEEAARAQLV